MVKLTNLRIADSQNLANANYSNPPSCSGRLRSRTLERRNGINGGDPRSGEEAVYAGFAYPLEGSLPERHPKALSVSRRFLEVQAEKGRLRARRISPRLIRFLPGDVAKWLEMD